MLTVPNRPGGPTEEIQYPFDENAIILDVGGFKGDFTAQMRRVYDCFVYVYEPITTSYDLMVERFQGDSKVAVFPHGMAAQTRTGYMKLDLNQRGNESKTKGGASCSFYNEAITGDAEQLAQVMGIEQIIQHLKNYHLPHFDTPPPRGHGGVFDLIKFNAEGEEFPLLRYMIDTGVVKLFRYIQVIFHKFYPEADTLMGGLRIDLKKTHRYHWGTPYLWESWVRLEES